MSDASPYAVSLDRLERAARVRPEDMVEQAGDGEVPTDLHPPLPVSATAGYLAP